MTTTSTTRNRGVLDFFFFLGFDDTKPLKSSKVRIDALIDYNSEKYSKKRF